jgi:argininosuccinate lyase
LPFRQAHHVTGQLVAAAAARRAGLEVLTLADMQAIEPRITDEVFSVLSVEKSVESRTSYGGTAPANVREQAQQWLERLGREGNRSETSPVVPSH